MNVNEKKYRKMFGYSNLGILLAGAVLSALAHPTGPHLVVIGVAMLVIYKIGKDD
jgi:hypothetical protein